MDSTTARPSPSGSGTIARRAPTVRPWAHLSPDLLLDVSNRLDDAADFVRFHAVCIPWRAAAPSLLLPSSAIPLFSPQLLGLCRGHILQSTVNIQCISSFAESRDSCSHGDVVLAEPPPPPPPPGPPSAMSDRNWVANADGTASWLFVPSPEPRLVNILTGAVTRLPLFPDDDEINVTMENACGIVYRDRTVFLYRFLLAKSISTFTAAILHPDATTWTFMKKILEIPTGPYSNAAVVYHDGKVLVSVGDYFWSVLAPGDFGGYAGLKSRWSQIEKKEYSCEDNYVMESQGELLWVSVLLERDCFRGDTLLDLTSALSVRVYTLEKKADDVVMRWRVRDGWSLADRIIFLGSPTSFAVDAHKLDMSGGCAYFVFRSCVFRHCIVAGKTELVKQLPLGWGTRGSCLWIWRQPTIAAIQEIREGLKL